MSHVVTIKTQIHDLGALRAACQRLKLDAPVRKTTRLFSGEATGHCVALPGWRYLVVCDLASGELKFDNFENRWGDRAELNRLVQMYAVEKARLEARRRGHSVVEQQLADGTIKLTIQIGDAREDY